VFGRRGPWRVGAYDDRYFETLPQAAYVAPPLLAELQIDVVLAVMGVAEDVARRVINTVLESEGSVAHLAVRTTDGYTLLREAIDGDPAR
jgi:hypothetical protein